MILNETINKLLRDVVNLLLSSPAYTIAAKQKDAPRPTGAYGSVDFISSIAIGVEQRSFKNNISGDDLTENIEGMREIMMSISFYRDSAINNANQVYIGFIRESVQSMFRSAGVGFTRRSDVREISDALENGWEERAQFDIFLNIIGTDSDIVKSILSVDMASEFQFRGMVYNSNIEVQ
tara:strand:+ start:18399 stop:18935 length:537 start_codon:yes stop_codon:yes gene_type:complete